MQPLFEDTAELPEEARIGLPVRFQQFLELAQHLRRHRLLNPRQLRILLENLARHVERQIVGIHHAADEPQIVRNQLLALVGDEDAADVELKPTLLQIRHQQIERRLLRQKQQRLELAGPLGGEVNRLQIFGPAEVGEVRIEALVLLFGDLRRLPQPDRLLRIEHPVGDGFGLVLIDFDLRHDDRILDEVGIFVDDSAQFPAFQILFGVLLEVEGDFGARFALLRGIQLVFALAAAAPAHCGRIRAGLLRDDDHFARHHERRIESDAELTDQFGQFLFLRPLLLEKLQKRTGAALGDGADVLDDLVLRHADAVVADGEGLRFFIRRDADLPLLRHFRMGQAFEARLVDGVGGVGHQFPQENVAVGVQ